MKDWKKEFDKKFPLGGEIWVLERHKREVTDWLKTTLQEYERELLEQQRDEIVEELEGLKKDESFGGSTFYKEGKNVAHNDTLDQAIQKIKEK